MTILAEQVLGGVDRSGVRPYVGHFRTDDGTLLLESNLFPVVGEWYSLSFNLSAAALDTTKDVRVTYGLVGFDFSYTVTTYYTSDRCPTYRIIAAEAAVGTTTFYLDSPHILSAGEQVLLNDGVSSVTPGIYRINAVTQDTFTIDSSSAGVVAEAPESGMATGRKVVLTSGGSASAGFLDLKGLYQTPDDTPEMCFRLEVKNCVDVWVDNVLVDPHESQYDYFDGNSTDSFPEDYRWMGGRDNRHFSLWYNNYTNTHNRLFSDWDTAEQVYKSGLVEEWAPTGSNIMDHWDAVTSFTPLNWVGPAFYPLHDDAGTPVSIIDIQKSVSGSVLPEGHVGAEWDDSVFTWDDPVATWDDNTGVWE